MGLGATLGWLTCGVFPAQAAQTFDPSGFDGSAPTPPASERSQSFDPAGFDSPTSSATTGGASSGEEPPLPDFPRLRRFGGTLVSTWARDAVDNNSREDRWEGIGLARLASDVALSDRAAARVGGRFFHQFTEGNGSDGRMESRLMEACADFSMGNFDLAVGQQTVTWGRTELIGPTNNITPRELRHFLDPDPENLQLPIPMVRIQGYFGSHRLELIGIPFFRPSEIHVAFHDFSMLPQGSDLFALLGSFNAEQREKFMAVLDRADRPPDDLSAAEAAVKLDTTLPSLDFSLSWFSTRSDIPRLNPRAFFAALPSDLPSDLPDPVIDAFLDEALTNPTEALSYPRRDIYGADLSAVIGEVVVNAEAALIHRMELYRDDLSVDRAAALFGVGGLEYRQGETWFLNAQYFHIHVPGMEGARSVLMDRHTHGATIYLRSEWVDTQLLAELRGGMLFNQQALWISPRLTWRFLGALEGWSLRAGFNGFEAPRNEYLHVYDPNDQAFVGLAYAF